MVLRPIAVSSLLYAPDASLREVFDALDAVLDAAARSPCTVERDASRRDPWQLIEMFTDPPVELLKGNAD